MPLITIGSNFTLKLKIPSQGDVNWAQDFKNYFALPISTHDHTGIDGKGAKLGENSISDKAIKKRHVSFNLEDLINVLDEAPTENQYLKYVGGSWQAGDIDASQGVVNNAGTGTGSVGTDEAGINLDVNAEVFVSDVQGGDIIDFSQRNQASQYTMTGIKFIINSATIVDKSVRFMNLKDCLIISNLDIEVLGSVENCIIVMQNEDQTAGSEGATLDLVSAANGADTFIVKSSRILTDNIKFSNSTAHLKNILVDSEVKTKYFNLQLLGGSDSNISKLIRSTVDVSEAIVNYNDLSILSGNAKFSLEKSKLAFSFFKHNVNSALENLDISNNLVDIDSTSEFKNVSTDVSKLWNGTLDKWDYILSPEDINTIVITNSNKEAEQLNISEGHIVKASPTGLISEDNVVGNINDVDLGNYGASNGDILEYSNSTQKWEAKPNVEQRFTFKNSGQTVDFVTSYDGYNLSYDDISQEWKPHYAHTLTVHKSYPPYGQYSYEDTGELAEVTNTTNGINTSGTELGWDETPINQLYNWNNNVINPYGLDWDMSQSYTPTSAARQLKYVPPGTLVFIQQATIFTTGDTYFLSQIDHYIFRNDRPTKNDLHLESVFLASHTPNSTPYDNTSSSSGDFNREDGSISGNYGWYASSNYSNYVGAAPAQTYGSRTNLNYSISTEWDGYVPYYDGGSMNELIGASPMREMTIPGTVYPGSIYPTPQLYETSSGWSIGNHTEKYKIVSETFGETRQRGIFFPFGGYMCVRLAANITGGSGKVDTRANILFLNVTNESSRKR